MITKQKFQYLTDGDGFRSGSPALVHGTSVEAVIQMLSIGRLPSSLNFGASIHPTDNGYLFFVPRKKSFVGHPIYDSIEIDLDGGQLEDRVKHYAAMIQEEFYVKGKCGPIPPRTRVRDLTEGATTFAEMKEKGFNVSPLQRIGLRRLERVLDKKKGVCIGISDLALELPIENGCDTPGREVMIYLPQGIDIKYVQYVYPFGEEEERALNSFARKLPQRL